MDIDRLKTTLQNAGFSQYQSDAYLALVKQGASSATDVAEATSIPKSRIYDVLRDLEDEGYVETFEQNSLHARPSDPEEFLSELRTKAQDFDEAADEIDALWERPSFGDHQITLVKRHETVLEAAEEAVRDAEDEVQLSATPSQFNDLRPVLLEAFDRGVMIKISLHETDGSSALDLDDEEFMNVASEVRYRNLPAPFLALIDRTETYFSSHTPGNRFGLLVDNYTLTYVFYWYFQISLWEIWDVVYSDYDSPIPKQYVDVRRCVRELDSLLSDGVEITATVIGLDRESNEWREISGRIAGTDYEGTTPENGSPALSEVAGKATLYIDTGDQIVSVGSWGAIQEDVEGRRIHLHNIDR
ncbi:TrmB family transcriptional regulator [Halorussus salinisoli]|uniref:TrmB family transcriptional regulator n=1 Tax=Halorussus salinisoli TaxID=2558242 RepID=UPI0010C2459D|nr:TrmB family transcriptional regulator [Halorussus salinisoli]